MRLTKTAYLFGDKGEYLGRDSHGRPIYGDPKPDIPFKMEIEPFSPKLAETQYGVFVEVRYRLFTYPDSRLKLNKEFVFKETIYKITQIMDYEKHFEVLVKDNGEYEP